MLHPDYGTKVGAGVQGFEVQRDKEWGTTRHFVIVRTDGTRTDFSYQKCLMPASRLKLFKQACRHVIADQILHFRDQELANLDGGWLVCPVLGVRVGRDQIHVDHAPPWTFDRLVTDFANTRGVDVDAVILTGFQDNEIRKGFEDPRLNDEWRLFHKSNARLRLVSKRANLSEIRKAAQLRDIVTATPFDE
jgi:hypothetical protein